MKQIHPHSYKYGILDLISPRMRPKFNEMWICSMHSARHNTYTHINIEQFPMIASSTKILLYTSHNNTKTLETNALFVMRGNRTHYYVFQFGSRRAIQISRIWLYRKHFLSSSIYRRVKFPFFVNPQFWLIFGCGHKYVNRFVIHFR